MWILIAVIGAIVIAAVYFLLTRKTGSAEALPEAPQRPQLDRATEKRVEKAPEPKGELKPAQAPPEPKSAPVTPPAAPPAVAVKTEVAPQPEKVQEPAPAAAAVEPVQEKAAAQAEVEAPRAAHHERDVEGLRKGLGKSRAKEGFFGRLARLIGARREIDPAIMDELEEVLLTSDVGVNTTQAILERIREGLNRKELTDQNAVWQALRQEAVRILKQGHGGLSLGQKPTVVLLVGVNGAGKTTTIGKLATQLKADGKQVVLAAGDTFRAAAVQQLEVWGKRVGCEVVKGKDGADPGAVIFDAIQQAVSTGSDVVLADTAGRLHTKAPLMDELKKVVKTMGKAVAGAPHEIWLIIDSTNGQNALAQSRQFAEALPLSGIVLTKLDGTAKGGVILGICDELKVPVRYIGIGERSADLREFDAEEFVEALLGGNTAEDIAAA